MAPLVWLITGCSSGFGAQFVHSALARGDKVIATGRNAATKLKHLDGTGAAIVDLDVSLPEAEVKNIVDKAAKIHGRIDVLVNNAGYGFFGAIEETRRLFDVNVFGALAVTRAVLPHMRAQQSGTIAFVGSMYAWWTPGMVTAYGAAKGALKAIVDGLAAEVRPFNIRTIDFEPGFFQTPLTDGANLAQYASAAPPLDAYADQRAAMVAVAAAHDGNERGDVGKGVELMVDVIRGEGRASGRSMPLRLPIGEDAVKVVEATCHNMLKVVDAWREEVVGTTDRDEFESDKGIESIVTVPDIKLWTYLPW
ncbi:NAD(P)-binding protein [Parathielavia appendiculata]|uniref:NAD(P)-binding protein n=1 Tax=Parathielavia appendiculata TaxID=2587402 RepID=A0AAN6TVI8_9PEZI|nr:NAD(P)-binding protein [Parathielavia appendiculata]